MDPEETYQDEDWLRTHYEGDGLTTTEIGHICGVTQNTILMWMRKHDIEPRSRGRRRTDPDVLYNDIKRVARDIGRIPNRSEYDVHGNHTSSTVVRIVGAWRDVRAMIAQELDHLPYNGDNMQLTEEEILADIHRVAMDLGHVPSQTDYDDAGCHCVETVSDRFGSWSAGRDAAIEGENLPTPQGMPSNPSEVLADVRRVAEELGRPPKKSEYDDLGAYNPATVKKHHGTWYEIRDKAAAAMG